MANIFEGIQSAVSLPGKLVGSLARGYYDPSGSKEKLRQQSITANDQLLIQNKIALADSKIQQINAQVEQFRQNPELYTKAREKAAMAIQSDPDIQAAYGGLLNSIYGTGTPNPYQRQNELLGMFGYGQQASQGTQANPQQAGGAFGGMSPTISLDEKGGTDIKMSPAGVDYQTLYEAGQPNITAINKATGTRERIGMGQPQQPDYFQSPAGDVKQFTPGSPWAMPVSGIPAGSKRLGTSTTEITNTIGGQEKSQFATPEEAEKYATDWNKNNPNSQYRMVPKKDTKSGGFTVDYETKTSIPAEGVNKIIKAKELKSYVDEAWAAYDKSKTYTGIGSKLSGQIREKIPGLMDDDEKLFRLNISKMVRKVYQDSGAQINEKELQRLLSMIPTLSLAKVPFETAMKDFYSELERSISTSVESYKQAGYFTGQQEGKEEDLSALSDEELIRRIRGGK